MSNRDAKPLVNQPLDAAGDAASPASLIALLNEDLADSRALHDLSLHMLVEHEPSALYGRIVKAAMQLLHSDFASLQMISTDAAGQQKLDLIAHCGFTLAAAEHWRNVDVDSTTSCGFALATGQRVIVPDVDTCPDFADTIDLDVYHETGIRAMQTTPLHSRDGALIGMLSTHWAHAYEPNARQLRLLDILAREAASLIERTRAEALLRESEARLQHMDRMKDQFLATLAHELRNPLAPIRNGLQILRLNQTPPGATRVFEMLDRQLDHMVRLVDDLMEVARINNGAIQLHRRHTDLSAVLQAAVELSRSAVEKAGHTLTVDVAPGPVRINGDEVRLAQVFSNLINNAAKYTPPGGDIHVSVTLQNDRATVRVKDSGIGFTAEEQSLLFTLFGRLQPQTQGDGLGIGLALAKKLVELHGGTISAASDGRNKGSCFSVSLPVDEASDASEPVAPVQELAKFDSQRVLVVDDNRDAADSLAELLRVLGCESVVFYDGAQALEALDGFAPTIAFIDLGMPGMDGYQFAQQIRTRGGSTNLRLIALTGWSQPEDRARSDSAGFDQHLTKPVNLVQLTDVLADGRRFDADAASADA
ncbi:Histidine kinase [Paraburkholderia sabiae]|uniref:hybrid sensor histidine kinase/response regulator n=1 Tax=Paraburkholderia sabiae TaxID=273251 RepID=UPI001CB52176|nr:ATP-binding protein [Paraburkholderia sabiae]CAG9195059.1 Histidine kinase [Paraburkholderia sabiae]